MGTHRTKTTRSEYAKRNHRTNAMPSSTCPEPGCNGTMIPMQVTRQHEDRSIQVLLISWGCNTCNYFVATGIDDPLGT